MLATQIPLPVCISIHDYFDAVIMLTWSDWKTEPRSNRYHYATRFATSLPVLFVQPWGDPGTPISVEPTEVPNIAIVHAPYSLGADDVQQFRSLLYARGIRRPLVWIYDPMHYLPLIKALPNSFRVFHATEDYVTEVQWLDADRNLLLQSLRLLLPAVDLLVGVSPAVVDTYSVSRLFSGRSIVLPNGCDAGFFFEIRDSLQDEAATAEVPTAIFQGGVNRRLDYPLILDLLEKMPDWHFQFCGPVVDSGEWRKILDRPNAQYLGALSADEMTRHLLKATVGIIPFINDQLIRNSLPLKAYEYVACGLPVVTVPIDALESHPELFTFAKTADEFANAIRAVAESRTDERSLKLRERIAEENSYDRRFRELTGILVAEQEKRAKRPTRLTVALLYDPGSVHIATIREHLEAFERYSSHQIVYIPASSTFWNSRSVGNPEFDLSAFDAVIVHYSIRLSLPDHFIEKLAKATEDFRGLKVLFIQDEYEGVEIARSWMDRLKFDVVYSCVPRESIGEIYPAYRFPATEFLTTLTGYVPEAFDLEYLAKPPSERKLWFAYRGRKLPPIYGTLGHEKYRIGARMKEIAEARGIPVDIEVDDGQRIYGRTWFEFLGSARATLGTESGSNVFDFDGSLSKEVARIESENPQVTFEELFSRVLAPHEGRIRMNQISPKIFEAIKLRTALVLFEGHYSGVVRPNEHFIPLKKDFSNVDDVLAKVGDDEYIQSLTERAYRDVIEAGRFSYRAFVAGIDSDLSTRVRHTSPYRLVTEALVLSPDGLVKKAWSAIPWGVVSNDGFSQNYIPSRGIPEAPSKPRRPLFALMPPELRAQARKWGQALLRKTLSTHNRNTRLFRAYQRIWHLLPAQTRARVVRFLLLQR